MRKQKPTHFCAKKNRKNSGETPTENHGNGKNKQTNLRGGANRHVFLCKLLQNPKQKEQLKSLPYLRVSQSETLLFHKRNEKKGKSQETKVYEKITKRIKATLSSSYKI